MTTNYFKTFFVLFFLPAVVLAQEASETNHQLSVSAYVDTYFAGYNTNLGSEDYQSFITVGARDNTFGINIAQFGIGYKSDKLSSNVILQYGDIAGATWSADFNMIQEANIGINLTDGLWLDAGFFATHIGTESFLPKNNMLSSTAFLTYNEPFYQAGAKLSYDALESWYFEFWILNGYNNFVDNNDGKSVGALITYNFNEDTSLTYTNLFGREDERNTPLRQNRFYQNVYFNKNWNDTFFLSTGLDFGIQTNSSLQNNSETASMFGGLLTTRYVFAPRWSVTGRAEIFSDNNGFISGTVINNNLEEDGVKLVGFTLGAEYKPIENSYFRLEGRSTREANDLNIFPKDDGFIDRRMELLVTLGFEIEKLFSF